MKANTNQAFEQMNQVAREWLAERDPRDIAQKAGICYDADNQSFTFSSLGVNFTLTYPDYCITPKVGKWQYLLIPASGRLLVDRSADHYLTIEDAVTVAEILIKQISVPVGQRTFATQS